MKIAILALAVLLMIALSISAQEVRGIPWGATPEEVLRIEGEDGKWTDDSTLFFERTIVDEPALLEYIFVAGGLAKAFFTILNNSTGVWARLAIALEDKYGEPRVRQLSELLWLTSSTTLYASRDLFSITLLYTNPAINGKDDPARKETGREAREAAEDL